MAAYNHFRKAVKRGISPEYVNFLTEVWNITFYYYKFGV